MPNGGALTIETANARIDGDFAARHPQARDGAFVVLAVAYTGNGATPASRDHGHRPFVTADMAGNAAGVGLSALNDFAERSNGFVTVENGAGRGIRIALYLPRANVGGA